MLSKNKATIDYSNTSNSNFLRFYFLLYPESDEDENGMICSKIRVLFIAEDGSSVAELGGVKSCIIIAIIYDLGVTVRKDPSKVILIELTASISMIEVINRPSVVTSLPYSGKNKKKKSQTLSQSKLKTQTLKASGALPQKRKKP
ncbi:hypothetical protein Tco_0431646 [Tanacetum coccineum]